MRVNGRSLTLSHTENTEQARGIDAVMSRQRAHHRAAELSSPSVRGGGQRGWMGLLWCRTDRTGHLKVRLITKTETVLKWLRHGKHTFLRAAQASLNFRRLTLPERLQSAANFSSIQTTYLPHFKAHQAVVHKSGVRIKRHIDVNATAF